MNLRKVYKSYMEMTEDARIAKAKSELGIIYKYLKGRKFSDDDILGFEVHLFRMFVSADRKVETEEHQLFNKIFGLDISYDKFFELCDNGASADFVDEMYTAISSFPNEAKVACVSLGLCIMSNDGALDESETALLEKFLD